MSDTVVGSSGIHSVNKRFAPHNLPDRYPIKAKITRYLVRGRPTSK